MVRCSAATGLFRGIAHLRERPQRLPAQTFVELPFAEGDWADAIVERTSTTLLKTSASPRLRTRHTRQSGTERAASRARKAIISNTPKAGWTGWHWTRKPANAFRRPRRALSVRAHEGVPVGDVEAISTSRHPTMTLDETRTSGRHVSIVPPNGVRRADRRSRATPTGRDNECAIVTAF